MNITLQSKLGDSLRTVEYEDKNDIVLGRPGAPLPTRQRRIARVMSTGSGLAVDHGTAPPVLLDLTPDRKISRVHARLYYELGTWWLEPLSQAGRVYLNSVPLSAAAELEPADVVRAGDTLIAVDFQTVAIEPADGTIESRLAADETQPDLGVREDRRLQILNRVSTIVAESTSRQGVVEGMIRELGDAFPRSSRRTLMLIEDKELLPRAFWPPDQSRISFTLARRAIQMRQSLHWTGTVSGQARSSSLVDVTDALYAPMIVAGAPIGVLHVDSVAAQPVFTEPDLQLLTVVATTVGAALRDSGAASGDSFTPLPSVFLSYAHAERAFVDGLAADLRRNRTKVWLDERLQTGDQWRGELAKAIANTDALVLVVSRQSLASEWVQWEVTEAQALQKPILPVLFEPCDLPAWLSSIQYADASSNRDNAIRELAARAEEALTGKRSTT
jgi:hypothetical protein